MSALEQEVACLRCSGTPKSVTRRGCGGWCATAKFRRGGSPVVVGTLEVQGPRANDRRVDGHGQRCRLASRILAESRGGAAGVASTRAVERGALRPALATLRDFVGDEHRAGDGGMRYA